MQDVADVPFSEPERRCPYCGAQLWSLRCGACFEDRDLELMAEFSETEVIDHVRTD